MYYWQMLPTTLLSGIEKDRYSRPLWISTEIEKDRVLGMQSDGLGEIEMFYLIQSPSSYLFQSFYFQQGYLMRD